MKIYLLRHGKSREHELNLRQSPSSDLGEVGKKQAVKAAERLKAEPIEIILSSHWPRALTTAKTVAEKLKLAVVIDERISELINNPILDGVPYESVINQEFLKEIKQSGHELDWKFKKGGESLREVINRVRKFKKEVLKKYPGKNILIVSHGYVISTLLALFLTEDETDDDLLRTVLLGTLAHENTAVSILKFWELRQRWQLVAFNDYSHLTGDLK